jgi:hypothetical protein
MVDFCGQILCFARLEQGQGWGQGGAFTEVNGTAEE